MARSDQPSYFLGFLRISPYTSLATGGDEIETRHAIQLKPSIGLILRSKRVRMIGAATLVACTIAFFLYRHGGNLNFDRLCKPSSSKSPLPSNIDNISWTRYAYIQYVTNTEYLCNSVMLFEILHRLGSKADRLMTYPASMQLDTTSSSIESRLLLKAQNQYGVKLMPIEVQHRSGGDPTWADSYTKLLAFNQTQYDRVLSLDSDSTVLQLMDELFLLPPCPVAMPRAYWLDKPYLSSQLILIQPSVDEFTRVESAISNAKAGEFDMEIVNDLYGKDCMILPHRRYDLLTGEFRSKGQHKTYLGNEYELWDPEKMHKEAKFLHFSDWPMPKPWLPPSQAVQNDVQPKCDTKDNGEEDCRARDMWLGFYSDFRDRRKNVCGLDVSNLNARSDDVLNKSSYEFIPELA